MENVSACKSSSGEGQTREVLTVVDLVLLTRFEPGLLGDRCCVESEWAGDDGLEMSESDDDRLRVRQSGRLGIGTALVPCIPSCL